MAQYFFVVPREKQRVNIDSFIGINRYSSFFKKLIIIDVLVDQFAIGQTIKHNIQTDQMFYLVFNQYNCANPCHGYSQCGLIQRLIRFKFLAKLWISLNSLKFCYSFIVFITRNIFVSVYFNRINNDLVLLTYCNQLRASHGSEGIMVFWF